MNQDIREIYRHLLTEITAKRLLPGDRLPTEKELTARFGTTRMNVSRALKLLTSHSLLQTRKRAGTYVAPEADLKLAQNLLSESNKIVYVLYSQTPHYIHWNESSFEALEKVLVPENFTVCYKHIPTGGERKNFQQLLKQAVTVGASALVIFPDMEDSAFMDNNSDLLVDLEIPVFFLNRSSHLSRMDFVSAVVLDHFGDGLFIGKLLKQQGYRHPVLLSENFTSQSVWYLQRLAGLRLGATPSEITEVIASPDAYRTAVKLIEARTPGLIFVALNNVYAAHFIDFCATRRLLPGRDFKLLAFDDNPLYRSYNLTSLAVRARKIGEIFGRMICDQTWHREFQGCISIRLGSQLIIRDTWQPKS